MRYSSTLQIEGVTIIINPHFYYLRGDGCIFRLHVEVFLEDTRVFEDLNMGLVLPVRMTDA
jgi:hypothetical protein